MEGQVLCLLRAARLIGDTPVSSTPTTRGPQAAVASSQGNLRGDGNDYVQQPDPLRDLLARLDHLPLGLRDHQLGGLE